MNTILHRRQPAPALGECIYFRLQAISGNRQGYALPKDDFLCHHQVLFDGGRPGGLCVGDGRIQTEKIERCFPAVRCFCISSSRR